MNQKRTKAVSIANAVIEEGGTELTDSDITHMPDAELFQYLYSWGFYWDGHDWVESN